MTSSAERLPAGESTEHVRELVARGQQGDRDALEELYLIHFDRIYSYLHVSVGNRHDAEDLTTQTFLKMLEKIGSFVDERSADELESALNSTGAGKPVVVLETEDGPLHVVVAHVAYYKRIVRAGRVGFGSG